MTSTVSRYRQRLVQEWPRLVVALVSIYGIYYAINTIQSTTHHIKSFGTIVDHRDSAASPLAPSTPASFGDPTPQLKFNTNSRDDNIDFNDNHNNNHRNNSSSYRPKNNYLLGQIRLLTSGGSEDLVQFDFEGRTEAAAIYTLLVISSLAILDNAIGLMVATRRSLRLTQIAFAIWCLRFLFRILSLISVVFMLVAGTGFWRDESLSSLPTEFNDPVDPVENSELHGNSGPRAMITITVLEVIIALVHGWSLLVLIRDLRNQPRPRTVMVRLWSWFCSSRWGQRLGLQSNSLGENSSAHGFNHNLYVGLGNGGDRRADVETSSIRSGSSGGGVWDREIAATLGFGNGLLSSGNSVRSVAASIPEMVIAAGRSRASSISSFSSTEKV
ncbi:hypothetical protein BGX28_007145 [Mortierella sp. GBA30]|nr:hypothetical protein BGX28_007145 [Mortierella sp. GBA30]